MQEAMEVDLYKKKCLLQEKPFAVIKTYKNTKIKINHDRKNK